MADELLITIKAKDGATQVFKAVAQSAQEVGDAIEQAGRKGDSGFDKVAKGAKDAEKAVDRTGKAAKDASVSFSDFDVAVTALGVGLISAGNAALDQQQTIVGLESAYGSAADEMIRFADEMASVTIFNDDDILRGERYFATLRNNYDLTIQEVQELMQVTADLASAYGTTFEDASSRITAAIRGEGEAAEFLGLTMNQQAIDRNNLTLTMSNQEAAQFRLNALYQQTGVYQGTAQRLTETEVGTRAQLTNAVQDNAQAFASMIGPITSVTAGIALTTSGLGSMVGGFRNMATVTRNSQVAMSALGFAFNPVTLGLGALAVAGIATWNVFQEGRERTERLEDALISLGDVATNLRLGGRDQEASFVSGFITDLEEAQRLSKEWANDLDLMTGLSQTQAMQDGYTWTIDKVYELQEAYDIGGDEAKAFADAQTAIGQAFADSRVDHEALNTELDKLHQQFLAQEITMDEYMDGVISISNNLDRFKASTEAAGLSIASFNEQIGVSLTAAEESADGINTLEEALQVLTSGLEDGSIAADEFAAQKAELDRQMATGAISVALYEERLIELARAYDEAGDGAEKGAERTEKYADEMARLAENADAAAEAATAAGTAIAGAGTEGLDAWAKLNEEFVQSWLELSNNDDFLSQLNLTNWDTRASNIAGGINDVSAALENNTRIVIGNTDAIGSQMQGLKDWSDDLIGDPGYWAEIDDLLIEGRVSLEQYTDAQQAQIEITEANATVQRDLLAIQAMQAPVLADNATAMADYVEQLRLMNDGTEEGARQQAAALGWMDEATQGRVDQLFETYQMLGQLGPEGQVAFQGIIDGIVATDPYLTAILEGLGLIEQQLDGSYTFNADGFDQAASDIDNLNRTIADLIDFLDDGALNDSYKASIDLEVEGREDVQGAKQDINDLAALGAQERIIDIALRTKIELPTDRDWAQTGYTGGWGGEPITIPTELEEPEPLPPMDLPPVRMPVTLDFGDIGGSAAAGAQNAAQQAMSQIQNTVEITVTQVGAEATQTALEGVTTAAAAIPDAESVSVSAPGATGAASEINSVTAAANAVPSAVSVSVAANGALGAAAALYSVAAAAAAIPREVNTNVTTTIRTVNLGTNNNVLPGGRHGGVMGYAHGGVVFEAAEAGYEMLHYPTGGVLPLMNHGVYEAPPGSYVQPHNAVGPLPVASRGDTYEIHIHGNVYGIDDLADSLEAALTQRRAGFGGVRV